MAMATGFILVALLGIVHHFGILGIKRIAGESPHVSVLVVFTGLLALHSLEILAFAAAYRGLLQWDWMGSLGGEFDRSWRGLIYFSGINFATLGYTQIEANGPIRIVNMMQSLGGFMVLTWSATFLYSVWKKSWED